jgi:cytochrome c biogenesis protein CcdA
MLGLFSVLSYAGYVSWITAGVAVLAGVLGLLQVKDYVWFHEGPTLGIADERKPGLFKRMRGLAASDRSMPAVLLATAGLAVGVSLLETPCTLGLPLLWTNLLAERGVGGAEAAVLFAVYMLVFLVDELIVFALAVTTMRAAKLQERHGRELKLVSGVVMLALAATLLLAPDVMESALGALAVFGLAGLIIAVVLIVGRIRNPVPGAARH